MITYKDTILSPKFIVIYNKALYIHTIIQKIVVIYLTLE